MIKKQLLGKRLIWTVLAIFSGMTLKAQNANFVWAKGMGGIGYDRAHEFKVDSSGNIYSTGEFTKTADFNPGSAVYNLTADGDLQFDITDAFVSKLNNQGEFEWALRIGGISGDYGSSIDILPDGNILSTGFFSSTVDLDPGPGVINATSGPGGAMYVLKLSPDGNLIWAKYINALRASKIDIDQAGNIYVTGGFSQPFDADPDAGVTNIPSNGNTDVFIGKYDPDFKLIWAKQIGGSNTETPSGIIVDHHNNVFTYGIFSGTVDFDPGPQTHSITSLSSYFAAFISKLDSAGNYIDVYTYGTALNTSSSLESIVCDDSNNLYIRGWLNGTMDIDPGSGVYNLTSTALVSQFLCKLDRFGALVWAKRVGGGTSKLVLDRDGYILGTGFFNYSTDFDVDGRGNVLVSKGSSDIYIDKHDTSGNLIWVKQVGNLSEDVGVDIAVDSNNNIYTLGHFSATVDFDPSTAIFNLPSMGFRDIFILKMNTCYHSFETITDTVCFSYISPGGKVFNTTGVYVDTIPNTTGCDSIITIKLTINTIDTTIYVNNSTLSSAESDATFQWISCDDNTPVSGETSSTFTPTESGSYAVVITKDQCIDTSACHTIIADGTGINEAELHLNDYIIYPNPVTDQLDIRFNSTFRIAKAKIYNLLGQELKSGVIRDNQNIIMDLVSFPPGVYIVQLTVDEKKIQFKIMKY